MGQAALNARIKAATQAEAEALVAEKNAERAMAGLAAFQAVIRSFPYGRQASEKMDHRTMAEWAADQALIYAEAFVKRFP